MLNILKYLVDDPDDTNLLTLFGITASRNIWVYGAAGAVGVLLCIVVIFLVWGFCKGQNSASNKEKQSMPDKTVLLSSNENVTVLMQHVKGDKVILIPDGVYEKKVELDCSPQITIGRRQGCDFCIPDDTSVSGVHCVIFYNRRGQLAVRDNDSSNGTFLNGKQVLEESLLGTGDVLEIGRTRYDVQIRNRNRSR